MSDGPAHIPVLLEEVVRVLAPREGETYVDCTAGLGGHAERVAGLVGPSGTVVLNDADPTQLERAAARLAALPAERRARVVAIRGNYAELPGALSRRSPALRADMVLADLGFSSAQVDDPARGLSFMRDGPLDMRLDPTLATTAADLVNTLPEHELARTIRELGEDRNAARIARKLVEARRGGPILTTQQLAETVRAASGGRGAGIDPATRTFQALRIAVNDELGSLQALLDAAGSPGGWLNTGARLAVISFHSLEDRIVKRSFAALAERGRAEVLTRRPVEAGPEEVRRNVRARSAKLRAVRLLPSVS